MLLPRVLCLGICLASLLASVVVPHAVAATRAMTEGELVRNSSVVVDAWVKRLTSHWNQDRSLIFTTVQLDVSQTLYSRESPPGASLEIEILGGELDGVGLMVSEASEFQVGEHVLVFAKPWAEGHFVLTGGPCGVMKVDDSGIVVGRPYNVKGFASQIPDLAR